MCLECLILKDVQQKVLVDVQEKVPKEAQSKVKQKALTKTHGHQDQQGNQGHLMSDECYLF